MFVFSNFLIALANILSVVFSILTWLILIRALISWVNPDPYNPIVQFLYKTTEPILEPIRRIIPFSLRIGIDISPIVAFLIIYFLKDFLVSTLYSMALKLG